jgi:KUP system potassium uptake protein
MTSWWSGQRRLAAARRKEETRPEEVLARAEEQHVHRVPGTAVFLTRDKDIAPVALRAMVDVGQVMAERVVLLSWRLEDTPRASPHEAVVEVDTFEDRYAGIVGVDVTIGYRERLDVAHVLDVACRRCPDALSDIDPDTATYVVSEPIPRITEDGRMARWRQRIFVGVDRLATDRVEQLSLPRDRSIVVGREFDL